MALLPAPISDASILCREIEDSARVIYKFCTAFFVNLAQILCTFFRKEEKTDLQALCINFK